MTNWSVSKKISTKCVPQSDGPTPDRWKRLLPGMIAAQERALSDDSTELLVRLDQKIDPRHCALVVIDVQNDFAASGAFFDKIGADLKPIQTERVPTLLRLIAAARKAGVLVIFVQVIYDAYFIDYYVTVVADCCGAASEQDHVGPLGRFSQDYGQVVDSSEVTAIWKAGCATAGQPAFASVSN